MPTYNVLYSNTMTGANQNPFDPTNWSPFESNPNKNMQILNHQGVIASSSPALILYTGGANVTNDQWVGCTLNSAVVGSEFNLFVRDGGYSLTIQYGGPTSDYTLSDTVHNTTILSGTVNVTLGTTSIGLAAQGDVIGILVNGSIVNSVVNGSTASGIAPWIGLQDVTTPSDTGIINLELGSITYSVQGNAGIAGATVSWTGPTSGSTTADGSGNYNTGEVLNVGSYTITPSLTGYSFSPTNLSLTVNADLTGQNFTASQSPKTISGNVGVGGATVSYSGTASGYVTADGSGNYTIPGLFNGLYTITPSSVQYIFAPTNQNVTINNANVTNVNFAATQVLFDISGNVGVPGVTIEYTGTSLGEVTADNSGDYVIVNVANGSYVLLPENEHFSFSPPSQDVEVSGTNVTGINFTASRSQTGQTVVQGRFQGTSVQNAFPQNSRHMLDLMQIKNRSGDIVWNLDYQGNVTVNPSSFTNGTILGQFSGSSWGDAFIANNANPYQFDIIQVYEPTGTCIWFLDYTGTAYSVT